MQLRMIFAIIFEMTDKPIVVFSSLSHCSLLLDHISNAKTTTLVQ